MENKLENKFIAYYRVSTKMQGQSGLGLEAQEVSVKQYCIANGICLISSYTEIETGKKDNLENRPILQKALGHCKRISAILIIAKLDRLSRSVRVTSLLHSSNIEFIACDFPMANRFTIQIMAAVAEQEAKSISDRTKAALGALKARGVKLGSHRPECSRNLSVESRIQGSKISSIRQKQNKYEAYSDLLPDIFSMRKSKMTYKDISKVLNNRGDTTRTGCKFAPSTIYKIVKLINTPNITVRGILV